MHYKDLMSSLNKEKLTKKEEENKRKELLAYIKTYNHLYDDHGSAIIGSRDNPPVFPNTK